MLAAKLRRLGKLLKGMSSKAVNPYVSDLLNSKHFDPQYYSRVANRSFRTSQEAATHYLASGEVAGVRPSPTFDPDCYLKANPDLRALAYPLLVHYIRHGEKEARFAVSSLEESLIVGRKPLDKDKDTAIVVVHEMSRTGAPILGLNLVRSLSKRMNVIAISGRKGDLLEDFLDEAVCVVTPAEGGVPSNADLLFKGIISPLVEGYGVQFAIINSVEVAAFAPACHLAGLPCVSLVHEFADYTFPKSKITDVISYSQRVVFSSRLTEKTFREYWEFGGKVANTCVIPQGKCDVPEVTGGHNTPNVIDRLQKAPGALVIGCGYVQMRKGVDLFVATANAVIKELGKDTVRFAWVGAGYDPEKDEYSRWLKSQIERSDIEGAFEFVKELGVADLNDLYHAADVMFLSSRLDPFPNVAIDAMHAGLPIVSFEGASGVAEYISRVDNLKDTVVPHLDVGGAARQIISLLRDAENQQAVSETLLRLAKEQFVFEDYTDKILGQLEIAKRIFEQERRDEQTLEKSEMFAGKISWVGALPKDRNAAIRDYIRISAAGSFPAEPRVVPGLNIHTYAKAFGLPNGNPLAEWIRRGEPDGAWRRDVAVLRGERKASTLRVAMHIHLHYLDMLDGILLSLSGNATKPDLFITISSDEQFGDIQKRLREMPMRARIRKVANRGRDIGPMLSALANELSSYDIIGHFHGKKSDHIGGDGGRDFVTVWRNFLTENLIGGKVAAVDLIAQMFETDSRLGLVFPEDPFICGWGQNKKLAEELAQRLGIHNIPDNVEFPVGNMFFARADAIRPLLDAGFTANDFPEEPIGRDGTILHAIERMMPTICEANGFTWTTTQVDGVRR